MVTQGEAVPSSHFTSRAQNDRKTTSNKKPRVTRKDSERNSKAERGEESEAKVPETEANEEGENVQAHGLTGTLSAKRRDDPAGWVKL